VKPLQYFCLALPVSCLIHQRKLLFWENINSSDNLVFCEQFRVITTMLLSHFVVFITYVH